MAKPRLKPSGKWEIGLRHPSLPGGRKYFTFDTEPEAVAYGQQWKLMKGAGLAPPVALTTSEAPSWTAFWYAASVPSAVPLVSYTLMVGRCSWLGRAPRAHCGSWPWVLAHAC